MVGYVVCIYNMKYECEVYEVYMGSVYFMSNVKFFFLKMQENGL